MRNISHFVVMTNTDASLALAHPSPRVADPAPPPSSVMQWGCAGPWVLAWGRPLSPRRDGFDELPLAMTALSHSPMKSLLRRLRERLV
jgi:hypothetical protein